jgi:hypothetical protein
MNDWSLVGKLVFSVLLLGVGTLYFDLLSLVLEIRRNRTGHGSSGVRLIAIPVYALGVWLLPDQYLSFHKGYVMLALLVFHLLCHWVVPLVHRMLTSSGSA